MNLRYWLAPLLALAAGAARAEAPVTTSGDELQLNGYANVEYERMLSHQGDGDPHGAFDLSELDVVLNYRAAERLRVAADVGFDHGVATGDGYGDVTLQYGWAEYEVRDWLRVRAGKMFTPFGIYNEFHTAKTAILSVKEPRSTGTTSKLGAPTVVGWKGRPYPRWGTGVAVLGNGSSPLGEWDYVVSVTNGGTASKDETNPFEEDQNRQKAITARVRLEPTSHLQLGASYYTDWMTELDASSAPTSNLSRVSSYGAQLVFRPGRVLGVEAEYVATSVTPSAASGVARNWTHGAYVMVFGEFSPVVIPYARYEWLDPYGAKTRDEGQLYIAGVAVRVPGNVLLKAEVERFKMAANNPLYDGGLGTYDEVAVAAAVGF